MSCIINDFPTIVRGTTPTIKFCFSTVDVNEIVVAYITVKQNKEIKIEKDISDALKDEKHIYWTLSQEDTLSLKSKTNAVITCDWKLNTGLRGKANELTAMVLDPGKDEVI